MNILILWFLSERLLCMYLATILLKLLFLQDVEECAIEDLNSLLLRYIFIVLTLKFWKQDVAYHWYERLIRCLFLFPQMLLAHFRIVEIYYVKDVTHLLLPHGLSKNVMTMTIRMFHKAVLTSCCLPGTCWLSSVHIHLQNASAESSIFNF